MEKDEQDEGSWTFAELGLSKAALLGRQIAVLWQDTDIGDTWCANKK